MIHFGATDPKELVNKFREKSGKIKKNIKNVEKTVKITSMALGVAAVATILYFVLRKKK